MDQDGPDGEGRLTIRVGLDDGDGMIGFDGESAVESRVLRPSHSFRLSPNSATSAFSGSENPHQSVS